MHFLHCLLVALTHPLPRLKTLYFSQRSLHFPFGLSALVYLAFSHLTFLNRPSLKPWSWFFHCLCSFPVHALKKKKNCERERLEIQALLPEAPGANKLLLCTGTWRGKWPQNCFINGDYIPNYLLEFS